MTTATALIDFFKPWADLYSGSKVIPTVTVGVHIAALTFGGGLAIAADRMTLRAFSRGADERARQLEEVSAVHRPVLIGLVFLALSGVAMATADLETFLSSPVFWLKLALVTALLVNGSVLQSTESALRSGAAGIDTTARWNRLRLTSRASMALWGATLAVGVILANIS